MNYEVRVRNVAVRLTIGDRRLDQDALVITADGPDQAKEKFFRALGIMRSEHPPEIRMVNLPADVEWARRSKDLVSTNRREKALPRSAKKRANRPR
jgi:hypothetical protein